MSYRQIIHHPSSSPRPMDYGIRSHHRRFLQRDENRRWPHLQPLPHRHGRPGRVPRNVVRDQSQQRCLPLSLRHHIHRFPAPINEFRRVDRDGMSEQDRSRKMLAGVDGCGQQVRFTRQPTSWRERRARVGATKRIRVHGDECEGNGEH